MLDRPAIRDQHTNGAAIRAIARTEGASRNAVRRALAPGARDRYYRRSCTEDAEPAVRDVLADYPHMAVVDIASLIDWKRSQRTLAGLVAALRPEYATAPGVRAKPLTTIRSGSLAAAGTMQIGRLTCGQASLA